MRAIVFDLDGTLLEFTREYRDVLADAYASVAGEAPDGWFDAYEEAFGEAFRALEAEPYRRAVEAAGGSVDPVAFRDALLEAEVRACEVAPDAHGVLDRLAAGHPLGVLTNGLPAWQRHKLRAHGLEPYFDAVVVSYEVGAHKPDRAPFAAAERRLPADGYVMVGDADADVEGAREAGWRAHRYRGEGFGDLPAAIADG